jgi:phage regulator Rha-like protein
LEEIVKFEDFDIKDMIFEIRGRQVMLSSDVAKLYLVETKRINEVIKRNINRFPESFCFQLIKEEYDSVCSRSQFATLNKSGNLRGYNVKYLPFVLTEQGIMMLSGLLKSDIAVKVNIQIINAFVEMRKYLSGNNVENRVSNIETKVIEYDNNFKILFDGFETKVNNYIFFEGERYDAYSLLIDIFNTSKKGIIIIDNYVDKNLFDLLRSIDKEFVVVTNKYNNFDYDKYKSQYNNISLKINNSFHDRYIIIDNEVLYHCGASFKDLGNKCFCISKIIEEKILNDLIDML